MTDQEIIDRLTALGLDSLIPDVTAIGDMPYPLPKRTILRSLEVAATEDPDQAVDIMALHHDILMGGSV